MNHRYGKYLVYSMQFLFILMVVHGYMYSFPTNLGKYAHLVLGLTAIAITVFPYIIENHTRISVPWYINFLIVFSLYFHIAGGAYGWYFDFYPYYDKVAHLISSITVAFIGLETIFILDYYKKFNLNRFRLTVFVFLFTLSWGIFWEFGEFFFDHFYGTNFQYSPEDTTMDMTFNLVGAMTVALLGDYYLQFRIKGKVVRMFLHDSQQDESVHDIP
jgi:hypothetical protein